MPAAFVNDVSSELKKYLTDNQHVCIASKGIERNTCSFVYDVFKRNIAKKNNLNFIEIFEKNIKKITKEYVYSLIDKYLEE